MVVNNILSFIDGVLLMDSCFKEWKHTESTSQHSSSLLGNPTIERLSKTFTADGKRQRLPLFFYSFIVILK